MAEENRKTVLHDILKRERENKKIQKEKTGEFGKFAGLVKSKVEEKTNNSNSTNSTKPVVATTYDDAIADVSLDIRYYFVRDGEFVSEFRTLYNELKVDMMKYGINSRKFLEYCRESFDRYKNTNKLMPLDPMKIKAYKYVEASVRDLLRMMNEKFKK
jgi:hypothetical protein